MISVFAVACGGIPDEHHPPNQSLTFGELVYRIIRTNLVAAQSCSLEYVGQLEPHHADFVRSFDHMLSAEIRNNVPELLGSTIVPVVENGAAIGMVSARDALGPELEDFVYALLRQEQVGDILA